jgi:NAD(P)-dependent dehydrogenase (short-subunit alcohol dehydrogenase family)
MRTVIITGVSRGLGAALFDVVYEHGDRILAIGRTFTDTQRALADAEPRRVTLRRADLTDPTSLPDKAELARETRGSADVVLVHNAAVVEPIGAVGALPPDQIAAAVTVNLTAPMVLTNALVGARKRATIVFVSTGAVRLDIDGWSVYRATKAGGELFFDAVAAQDPRITVHKVNPGVMDTDMQATVRAARFADRARFVALHEHGELPDPADVARKIMEQFLV